MNGQRGRRAAVVVACLAAPLIPPSSPPRDATRADAAGASSFARSCSRPPHPVRVEFSKAAYPHIIRHIKRSWKLGYRKVLRINRPGADARRDKVLVGIPTKEGFDRDEAPAAVLRKRWRTDVAYVPSSENRSAGASLGNQIAPYCNGVRVKYSFVP